jgi:hypothetical protein
MRRSTHLTREAVTADRGFVAAAIVVGAIGISGLILVVAGLRGPAPEPAADPAGLSTTGTPDPAGTPDQGRPTAPGDPEPGDASLGESVRPGRAVTTEQAGRSSSGQCALPDGEQEVPLVPPAATSWEVFRRVVVPRSERFGPGRVDPDGFRRCYAHSPTGALFAAYSAVAALADDKRIVPDTDRMLHDLAAEDVADGREDTPSQLAGFRVIDASRDRVTIALALRVDEAFVSTTITLVWHESDWRLLAPRPGQEFGAPFSQQASLGDFVAWSGV